MDFPSKYNRHAQFVWDELLHEKSKHQVADFLKRCEEYGLVSAASQPHDNGAIRRYLVRNRIEIVKEFRKFYDAIDHTRVRKVTRSYIVHADHSFLLLTELEFYKVPTTPAALKKAMHTQLYRTVTPNHVEKYLLRNRLVRTGVSVLNENRVTFSYEIQVKQPLWLPTIQKHWIKKEIAAYIEKELWYPVAMAHRFTQIKHRTFI